MWGMNDEPVAIQFDRSPLADNALVQKVTLAMPTLKVPELREDVRALACRAWEDRTRSEYVGVMIVRRFHGLLADVNAPMDLQELAIAMQLQEQQHANLCMQAAKALGADGSVAFEVSELQQTRSSEGLAHQMMEMIVGTYVVGERVALALLEHAVKALPHSGFKDILKHILRDEVLHGRFGPVLLKQIREGIAPKWLPYPGDDWVQAFLKSHMQMMESRDVVEPDETAMFADAEAGAQLESLGIPNSRDFKDVYLRSLKEDVPKALAEAGIS
jgi:hypothetical protein